MHYASDVAKGNIAPGKIPPKKGVDIYWLHRKADGKPDTKASIAEAKKMIGPTSQGGYGIAFRPSLTSNHVKGPAIDMDIKWIGTLNIKDANGKVVQINTKARTGAGNKQLWDVGTPYDVVKKPNDAPHCSVNGH